MEPHKRTKLLSLVTSLSDTASRFAVRQAGTADDIAVHVNRVTALLPQGKKESARDWARRILDKDDAVSRLPEAERLQVLRATTGVNLPRADPAFRDLPQPIKALAAEVEQRVIERGVDMARLSKIEQATIVSIGSPRSAR